VTACVRGVRAQAGEQGTQRGALGLVVNVVVLRNTIHLNPVLDRLLGQGPSSASSAARRLSAPCAGAIAA